MTIQSNIMGIFPTPIYSSKLNRPLSEEELSFIDNTKLNVYLNQGNTTSKDTNILENEVFKKLLNEKQNNVHKKSIISEIEKLLIFTLN